MSADAEIYHFSETYTRAEALVNSGWGHPMTFPVLCKLLHARVEVPRK
jgi:hypothetical protein